MESPTGILVGIEGIDAVGKRTQSTLLGSWLRSRNVTSNTISFPDYSTVIGREIRGFLFGNRNYSPEVGHMLYAVNRWENKAKIQEMLSNSDVVIVNRYSASNFAYGTAIGLQLDWLVNLEAGLPKADLVLVLDAPPSSVSSRRGLSKDKYEKNIDLQERVRTAYLRLAKQFGWKVINAAQGIQSTNSALTKEVVEVLQSRGQAT